MKMNEKMFAAVTLLALGNSVKQTAERLAVTPKTITTWRGDPGFMAAVNQAMRDVREAQVRRLSTLADKALETIEDSFNNDLLKPEDKVKYSFKVLELCKIQPEEIGETSADKIRVQRLFENV